MNFSRDMLCNHAWQITCYLPPWEPSTLGGKTPPFPPTLCLGFFWCIPLGCCIVFFLAQAVKYEIHILAQQCMSLCWWRKREDRVVVHKFKNPNLVSEQFDAVLSSTVAQSSCTPPEQTAHSPLTASLTSYINDPLSSQVQTMCTPHISIAPCPYSHLGLALTFQKLARPKSTSGHHLWPGLAFGLRPGHVHH